MLDERLGPAEARGPSEQLESIGEIECGLFAAAELDAEHAAEVAHLASSDVMAGMRRKPGIMHGFDRRMIGEEARDGGGVRAVSPHPPRQGADSSHDEPAVERRGYGSAESLQHAQ